MSSHKTTPHRFLATTLIAAATAAAASAASLALGLPVWAMFIGWIAFFTRGLSTRSAFENISCVALGLIIGACAALSIPVLAAMVGPGAALPLVVFVVALLVVSLRGIPVMNNLLGYFLGLVAWFAAHMEPSFDSLAMLLIASSIGTLAGWVSHNAPSWVFTKMAHST